MAVLYGRAYVLVLILNVLVFRGNVHAQIPINMLQQMANSTAEEFIQNLLAPPVKPSLVGGLLFSETGSVNPVGMDIVAGMLAVEDGCTPREMSVNIPPHHDVNVVYFPTCTKVQQCGGCCGHESFECAPTLIEMEIIQVLQARYPYPGADRLVVEGVEEIPIERHIACECRCSVQAYHCNPFLHEYLPDSCRCMCRNEEMALSCPSFQHWDGQLCACACNDVLMCHQAEHFDKNLCRCEISNLLAATTTTPAPTTTTTEPDFGDIHDLMDCSDFPCFPGYESVAEEEGCTCVISHLSQFETFPSSINAQVGMLPMNNNNNNNDDDDDDDNNAAASSHFGLPISNIPLEQKQQQPAPQQPVVSVKEDPLSLPHGLAADTRRASRNVRQGWPAPRRDPIALRQPMVQGHYGHV